MIFCGHIFDREARLKSYELLMQACRPGLAVATSAEV